MYSKPSRTRQLALESLEHREVMATFGVPWPDPRHLTLSFVPDGTKIGGAPSDLFAKLDSQLPRAEWQGQILRAFQTWASAAAINIAVVADDGSPYGAPGSVQHDPRFGDIRIGATPGSSGVLALSVPYDPFFAGTFAGDVILNDMVDFSNSADLYSMMLHESGHVLGLDGSSDINSAMFDKALVSHKGLAPKDIAAIVSLYGARQPRGIAVSGSPESAQELTAPDLGAGLDVGATPLLTFGEIVNPGGVAYYRVESPSGYSGPLTVHVQTAGVSLLNPRITILDESGNLLATGASTTLGGGTTSATVAISEDSSNFLIRVEAASQSAFVIGRFSLAVTMDDRCTISASQLDALLRLPLDQLSQNDVDKIAEGWGTPYLNLDYGGHASLGTAEVILPNANDARQRHFQVIGSFDLFGQQHLYRVESPRIGSGKSVVLTASVEAYAINGVLPSLTILDENGVSVAAQVLANGNGIYTLQVSAAVSGKTYYVQVNDPANMTGNYQLTLDFGKVAAKLTTYAQDTLTPATATANGVFLAAQDQVFQFLLSADGLAASNGTAVHLRIKDSTGHEVICLSARAGQTISGPAALLRAGVYTISLSLETSLGGSLSDLQFVLKGAVLSDPIGPAIVNPSTTSPYITYQNGQYYYYYYVMPVPVVTPAPYFIYVQPVPKSSVLPKTLTPAQSTTAPVVPLTSGKLSAIK